MTAEKTEKYEIRRPPPAPPTMEDLIKHTDDEVCWSNLDLFVNYEPENTQPDWRKCKLQGSLLDTQADIHRRNILAMDSMKSFQGIYK